MRVFAAAALVLGGEEHLAARLGVSTTLVRAWSAGAAKAPEEAYVQAVVILHGELIER